MRFRRLDMHRFASALRIGALAVAVTCAPAWAQSEPSRPTTVATKPIPALLPLAVQFDVTSTNTGRTYRIYMSRPVVPAPATGYPVLYVLDADTAFPTAASQAVLASLLSGQRPVMVVGVGYPDVLGTISLRTRDLTPFGPDAEMDGKEPPRSDQWGGGDAFHKFMLEELRPIIASMATVDKSDQSLMGYSLGGLFTLHVLLTNPEAYRNYVIGSPAIYRNNKRVLQALPSFARQVQDGKVSPRILITADGLEQSAAAPGSLPENFRMIDNAREVADTLRKIKGTKGYQVDYALFANETHNSGIPASTSRGVAFVEGAGK